MGFKAEKGAEEAKKTFFIFVPLHFVNDFYSNIIPPVLPLIIASLALGHFEAGLIATSAALLSSILQPVFAYVADTTGRSKAVLATGFILLGTGVTLFSLSKSFWQLISAAIIMSIGLSTYHPQAMSSLTRAYSHAKGMILGLHGISGSIGFATAPLFVTLMEGMTGWDEALKYAFIPATVLAIALLKILPHNEKKVSTRLAGHNLNRQMVMVTVAGFLTFSSFRGLTVFIPTYYVDLGRGLVIANLLLFLALIPTVIGAPLGGYLSDRLGRIPVLLSSACIQSGLMALFPFSMDLGALVLVSIGLANAFSFPVYMALASELGMPAGSGIGIMFGTVMASMAFAPSFTGFLIDVLGYSSAFLSLSLIALSTTVPLYLVKRSL